MAETPKIVPSSLQEVHPSWYRFIFDFIIPVRNTTKERAHGVANERVDGIEALKMRMKESLSFLCDEHVKMLGGKSEVLQSTSLLRSPFRTGNTTLL